MAIKTKDITVKDGGEQKKYRISQFPLKKAEKWLTGLVFIVAKSTTGDLATIFSGGLFEVLRNLDEDKATKLSDELLECIQIHLPAGGLMDIDIDMGGHIEDIKTLFMLKAEAFKMQVDFLGIDLPSITPAADQK